MDGYGYSMHEGGTVMWSVAMGQVTVDALKDWWYEVLVDKGLKEGYVGFCDATQMASFEITSAQVEELSTLIELVPQRMFSKMAVLVQEGDLWRVADKVVALGDNLGLPIKMFFDQSAAYDWLALSSEVVSRISKSVSNRDHEG